MDRAEQLGGPVGPYLLQAAIAACHATAPSIEQTDWARITSLYEQLIKLTGSPVVELNHAVALGMAEGPEAGLQAVDRLRDEPALGSYPLFPSARGDLLEKLGRLEEAEAEFNRAAELAQNDQERQLMLDRARACGARNAIPNDDTPS